MNLLQIKFTYIRLGPKTLRLLWSSVLLLWLLPAVGANLRCWNYDYKIPPQLPETKCANESMVAKWMNASTLKNQTIAYQTHLDHEFFEEEYSDRLRELAKQKTEKLYRSRRYCIGGQFVKYVKQSPSKTDDDFEIEDRYAYYRESAEVKEARWKDREEHRGYRERRSRILGGAADQFAADEAFAIASMRCDRTGEEEYQPHYEHNETDVDVGEPNLFYSQKVELANATFYFFCCNTSLCNAPMDAYCLPGHPSNCTMTSAAPSFLATNYLVFVFSFLFLI